MQNKDAVPLMIYCSIPYWDIRSRVDNLKKSMNIYENTKFLIWSSVAPLEVFCKDFVNNTYENAFYLILEDYIWL